MTVMLYFFFNDSAYTEIYTYLHTLCLHDARPIYGSFSGGHRGRGGASGAVAERYGDGVIGAGTGAARARHPQGALRARRDRQRRVRRATQEIGRAHV